LTESPYIHTGSMVPKTDPADKTTDIITAPLQNFMVPAPY
jgi:hypothetical protein